MKISVDCEKSGNYLCQIDDDGFKENMVLPKNECIEFMSNCLQEYIQGELSTYPFTEPCGVVIRDNLKGGHIEIRTVKDFVRSANDALGCMGKSKIVKYYTGADFNEFVLEGGRRVGTSQLVAHIGGVYPLLYAMYDDVSDECLEIAEREYGTSETTKALLKVRQERRISLGGGLVAYYGRTNAEKSEYGIFIYDVINRRNIKVESFIGVVASTLYSPILLWTEGYGYLCACVMCRNNAAKTVKYAFKRDNLKVSKVK